MRTLGEPLFTEMCPSNEMMPAGRCWLHAEVIRFVGLITLVLKGLHVGIGMSSVVSDLSHINPFRS